MKSSLWTLVFLHPVVTAVGTPRQCVKSAFSVLTFPVADHVESRNIKQCGCLPKRESFVPHAFQDRQLEFYAVTLLLFRFQCRCAVHLVYGNPLAQRGDVDAVAPRHCLQARMATAIVFGSGQSCLLRVFPHITLEVGVQLSGFSPCRVDRCHSERALRLWLSPCDSRSTRAPQDSRAASPNLGCGYHNRLPCMNTA